VRERAPRSDGWHSRSSERTPQPRKPSCSSHTLRDPCRLFPELHAPLTHAPLQQCTALLFAALLREDGVPRFAAPSPRRRDSLRHKASGKRRSARLSDVFVRMRFPGLGLPAEPGVLPTSRRSRATYGCANHGQRLPHRLPNSGGGTGDSEPTESGLGKHLPDRGRLRIVGPRGREDSGWVRTVL